MDVYLISKKMENHILKILYENLTNDTQLLFVSSRFFKHNN